MPQMKAPISWIKARKLQVIQGKGKGMNCLWVPTTEWRVSYSTHHLDEEGGCQGWLKVIPQVRGQICFLFTWLKRSLFPCIMLLQLKLARLKSLGSCGVKPLRSLSWMLYRQDIEAESLCVKQPKCRLNNSCPHMLCSFYLFDFMQDIYLFHFLEPGK